MTFARERELARIRRMLERLHTPRLQMMLIVTLTGAVGFLFSMLLLDSGVGAMSVRYPAAVVFAYAAFLFFLWCWLRLKWHDWLDIPDGIGSRGGGGRGGGDTPLPWDGGGGHFGGGGASGSFDATEGLDGVVQTGSGDSSFLSEAAKSGGSFSDALDLEELAIVIIVIVALFSAASAILWIVWTAPALFAELMLDAVLASGLYRRLRGVTGDHWLRTAVRRTVRPFIAVAVLVSLAGAAMHAYAPEARSIGHVIHHTRAR